jgi:hydroxymethylglutaryl-CoA lyase
MQGLKGFIPTSLKAEYINQLLRVGYYAIDFGSFVSPSVIPQMKDTTEVLNLLDLSAAQTRLIAIVANERGAREACALSPITSIGYPFSVSETFQIRNTNADMPASLERLKSISEIAFSSGKELVLYVSMGFGNPYGDPYSPEVVEQWVEKLLSYGIRLFMLSDTVGIARPETIRYLFSALIPRFPQAEFGAHLHTAPHNWKEKLDAAWDSGCRRFDSVIGGYGGCPMAKDDLIGNMPTEHLVNYLSPDRLPQGFNLDAFADALRLANRVFPGH